MREVLSHRGSSCIVPLDPAGSATGRYSKKGRGDVTDTHLEVAKSRNYLLLSKH